MKRLCALFILVLTTIWVFTFSIEKRVGGPCEGCEAIFENSIPFEKLPSFTKLPEVTWKGKKPLGINGIVYKSDGKTPAPNVVLYVYHTNEAGIYPKKGDEKGWAKRHGYIRAWLKTDEKGEYKFVTLRPGIYPDRGEPAHIHITLKEPGLNEYYIDEFVFSDDPLLTTEKRNKLENRGGSGIIMKLVDVGSMFKGERNIYLGKNIPDYPTK
ncbi:dioxygenase family protein [Dyadobacter arcticus]|uniref:Protocatechuate 3,4-dioxygenase beta subunit n=1 Tax=Dyadobacter arcticus TaxID=1078754 RepID=A0ABX0USX8_9BACT|nr:intradiol ring-cleavage dioxygenase [Dyadobacter arcticus]NIJ55029.1 protocatechuate 3,4-dioxygenase beta subunit [Dyadobacter arcticus]